MNTGTIYWDNSLKDYKNSRPCVIFDVATGTRSETTSFTKAAAKIGCSNSFLGHKVHGYTISNRHPMDAIMQEIEQRDKQPYQISISCKQ
jgi:hypothetical protein